MICSAACELERVGTVQDAAQTLVDVSAIVWLAQLFVALFVESGSGVG